MRCIMIRTICVILFLSANSIFPQNFFPMKLGNKYQMKENYSGHSFGGQDFDRSDFKILYPLQDTVIFNNRFFQFNEYGYSGIYGVPFNSKCFYQYDSLVNILFVKLPTTDTIRIAIDFNVPKDSSFISFITGEPISFISFGKFYKTVMGDSVICFGMGYDNQNPVMDYYFASGKGLYSFYFSRYDGPWYSYFGKNNIVSAIIDTLVFNPITLKITSLSPLINRPLNTFPFVIHSDYQTNLDLTDTFKLVYQFQKGDKVYYSQTGIFNYQNNFTIQLPPKAQTGDILKVRAEIKDNSIFNNFACYPDTGFISIQILAPVVGTNDNKDIIYSCKLEQNYPDPFNPSTTIEYGVKECGFVKLSVYDFLGREIKVLINETKEPGYYQAQFNGTGLASGVYFYTLSTKNFFKSNKMILAK